MAGSLNVIALISGGKDSFYSILHCRQNGHRIVALANLYPAPTTFTSVGSGSEVGNADAHEEHDLNSFMFQTVGHTVIPLYEQALGIPLYRQEISGTAVQTGTSYSDAIAGGTDCSSLDETESLVPLLRRIIAAHPSANALSTGAILSTYQRTRVESVALRLGLAPLSYLWKYPVLPPTVQSSLLSDMQSVGLDARVIKVASGGLDQSYLWENVASSRTIARVERSMKRFGTDGNGAVLGEGGEFETLVVDGPKSLFKGRIVVDESDRRVVDEGGGSSWLQIRHAEVVMKSDDPIVMGVVRVPNLLDVKFEKALEDLGNTNDSLDCLATLTINGTQHGSRSSPSFKSLRSNMENHIEHWSNSVETNEGLSIAEETHLVVAQIKQKLQAAQIQATNIISTTIVLRAMDDFATINKFYGALFTEPNPPSRVTISCGDAIPAGKSLLIHLKIFKPSKIQVPKKCLHVQSQSYWAPANIGPYSQAISYPISSVDDQDSKAWTVAVAGQIPLVPHLMALPAIEEGNGEAIIANFQLQTILSFQHLWRIGTEMDVSWWTSAVAYLPRTSALAINQRARLAIQAWAYLHRQPQSDEEDLEDSEERDLWEERHGAMRVHGGGETTKSLPDWENISIEKETKTFPPMFAVEVEELPRQSGVEWHAHQGITGGAVKAQTLYEANGNGKIHQCIVDGKIVQTIVVIPITTDVDGYDLEARIAEMFAGSEEMPKAYLSYVDIGVVPVAGMITGLVPCRSIWDQNGEKVAAVLLLS
ncbi:hypothetical protein BP5796_10584 [Coleophoma crateriformis]|uniref:Diphthine--ammonia ligase n=1 Tax=Coleophoma crateriformis TaxID=565419 RepID=A0A3D8QQK0_9HELO|nr:hypothetical protein BP5796_10584 [Coleophoma crateriformis]